MTSKYVNNGTYGCVLKPAVSCSENTSLHDANTVSKVFKMHEFADAELSIYKTIVEKLDPDNKFTVKLEGSCKIKKKRFEKNELYQCRNLDKNSIPDELSQIIYEYGGIDLDIAVRQCTFQELFIGIQRVFNGIRVLYSQEYVHNDIKPPNIVYNTTTKKMSIIDFGLIQKFKDVYSNENDYFLNYRYSYFPPEYTTCSYYFQKKNMNNWKDDVQSNKIPYMNNIIEYNRLFIRPIDEDIQNNYSAYPVFIKAWNELKDCGKDKFASFLRSSISHRDFQKYISGFTDKIDVYMLGITLLELFYLSELYLMNDIPGNIDFYVNVLKLVRKMIEMDPRKRIHPNVAYREYRKILKEISDVEVTPFNKSPIKPLNRNDKKPTNISLITNTIPKERRTKNRNNQLEDAIKTKQTIKKTNADCPENKVVNRTTNRCVKKKCVKGKKLNPTTKRCKMVINRHLRNNT